MDASLLITVVALALFLSLLVRRDLRKWLVFPLRTLQQLCLAVLNTSFSKSLPPPPESMEALTAQWFTSVLCAHEIPAESSVESFTKESLSGGCHYKVNRYELTFGGKAKENSSPAKTIIVKLLNWDKPLRERLSLYLKKVMGIYHDKQTMYLESYQIESRFYKSLAPEMKGFKLPKVYYNYEDAFNNTFCLIMEPINLTEFNGGHPNGFSVDDARLCLAQLAKFHATFWNHPRLNNFFVWKLGSYWTGYKRGDHKRQVKVGWEKVKQNFGNNLDFSGARADLGSRLYKNLHTILKRFDSMPRPTLIHGDFKITNLFIDSKKRKLTDEAVWVIDWQWLGKGSGAIDVVYFLTTSVDFGLPKDVTKVKLKELVRTAYHDNLLANGVKNYPFKVFWQEFLLSMVDFFIYCVVAKWMHMWPNDVMEYAEQGKDGLHLRSFYVMQNFINLVAESLDDLKLPGL